MSASRDVTSVDDYIAAQPEVVRSILEQVRSTIRKAVPEAVESISYGLPTYKLHGRPLIYFAGWKQHFSIYPATASLVAAFADDLAAFEVNKGTIRFRLSERVPVKLIGRLAKFRAKELADGRKAKSTQARTHRAGVSR